MAELSRLRTIVKSIPLPTSSAFHGWLRIDTRRSWFVSFFGESAEVAYWCGGEWNDG